MEEMPNYEESISLKQRNEKAIEQLEELKNLYEDNYTVSDRAENIINILQGVDKE